MKFQVGPRIRYGLLGSLASCAIAPQVPAVLVESDVETRDEVLQTIRLAVNGVAVTLAEDVLTKSPIVTVDHANLRDPSGLPIDGRRLSKPDTFMLYLRNRRCVIVELRTNRQWTLSHARCTRYRAP